MLSLPFTWLKIKFVVARNIVTVWIVVDKKRASSAKLRIRMVGWFRLFSLFLGASTISTDTIARQ